MKLICLFLIILCSSSLIARNATGRSQRGLKIMGGYNAQHRSWPWMVSLRKVVKYHIYNSNRSGSYIGDHFCGGTLISNQFILTAGHCVYGLRADEVIAVLGINSLQETLNFRNTFRVVSVKVHENFKQYSKMNDVAILKLESPVGSNYIAPVKLPIEKTYMNIQKLHTVLIGWGSTDGVNSPKSMANNLQQTTLQILSNSECKSNMPLYRASSMYCAISNTDLKSNLCYGDSGGPLLFNRNNQWYLYGVSSMALAYSNYTCNPNKPSYYAKVPYYMPWIVKNIALNSGRNFFYGRKIMG